MYTSGLHLESDSVGLWCETCIFRKQTQVIPSVHVIPSAHLSWARLCAVSENRPDHVAVCVALTV